MAKKKVDWSRKSVQDLLATSVKFYMNKRETSIQELAYSCETSEANIRMLLNGKQFVSANLLARLCNYLNVDPHNLFTIVNTDGEENSTN